MIFAVRTPERVRDDYCLDVLESVGHLFCFTKLPNQGQTAYDFADAARLLMAVDDAGMMLAGLVERQKIGVLSEDRSPLSTAEFQVLSIGCADQRDVLRRGDVDSALLERYCTAAGALSSR